MLLVFAGVVGGLLAFGLIGIFVGPVVLAVANTLLTAWIDGDGEKMKQPNGNNRMEGGRSAAPMLVDPELICSARKKL